MSTPSTLPELLALASDLVEKLADAGIKASGAQASAGRLVPSEILLHLEDRNLAPAAAVELGLSERQVVNGTQPFETFRGVARGVEVVVIGASITAEAVAS